MKRIKKILVICLIICASMAATGWCDTNFVIVSLQGNGELTFTLHPYATNYWVEWAPSLNGPWTNSWQQLTSLVPATNPCMVKVPMFYRVVAQVTNDPSLVAYYPFNGNAHDESGHGHDGTVNGAIPAADRFGQANRAYSFDGVGNFIQIPYHSDFDINSSGFTVAAWFKASTNQLDPQGIYDIIDKSHGDNGSFDDQKGWTVQIHGSYYMSWDIGTGSGWGDVYAGTAILDDQWHHFACTFDGTNMMLYLDGVVKDVQPFPGTPANNDRDLFVGKHYALGRHFRGIIDEIRIYNRAIGSNEVAQLANNP